MEERQKLQGQPEEANLDEERREEKIEEYPEERQKPERYKNKKKKSRRRRKKKGGCLKTFLKVFVFVLVLGGVFFLGRESVTFGNGYGTGVDNGKILNKLSLLEMVTGQLYLNDIDTEKLEDSIYKGFAEGLDDPYAEYYSKKEYNQLMDEDSGEYQGIGVTVMKDTDTDYVEISEVFKDQPAYKAGLKSGDLIMKVNGESVEGLSVNDAVSKIKDKDREDVELTIYRDGETKEYTIKKSNVTIDTVSYEMKEGKIGYIEVTQFIENTDEEFAQALTDLQKQGMKSLIIDLRDNGGGLVDTCVNMVSHFVAEDDLIVYTEDKNGEKQEYKSDDTEVIDVPIVLLVNGNTASASEIMTGCLKDYGKAEVVGTTTYGKGIVQSILPLTDGSAIKFTIAEYFTPKGTSIHKKGITPDVEVEMSEEQQKKAAESEKEDTQLQKALELLKK